MKTTARLLTTMCLGMTISVIYGSSTAHAVLGDAYSVSKQADGIPLNSFTTVVKRKLPPGSYAVTSTGIIRNSNTLEVAYIECVIENGPDVSANFVDSEFVTPVALGPGVPGAGTWALTTTVEVTGDGGTVGVSCVSFGPAPQSDLKAWWPSLVAVKVRKVSHKLIP